MESGREGAYERIVLEREPKVDAEVEHEECVSGGGGLSEGDLEWDDVETERLGEGGWEMSVILEKSLVRSKCGIEK